jgi:hypothetical protein
MDSRRTAADRRSMNPAIADPERVRRIAAAVLGDE